jgi:DNA-binding XRE family transcriptional regulator
MLRGRKPKLRQRRQIERLRARGHSLAAIARQLGISRQAVHDALKRRPLPRRPILCRRCGATIAPAGGSAGTPKLLCRSCLARLPRVGFALRLASLRHAAGLTQAALAQVTGVKQSTICKLESGRHEPRPESRERLLTFLEPAQRARA